MPRGATHINSTSIALSLSRRAVVARRETPPARNILPPARPVIFSFFVVNDNGNTASNFAAAAVIAVLFFFFTWWVWLKRYLPCHICAPSFCSAFFSLGSKINNVSACHCSEITLHHFNCACKLFTPSPSPNTTQVCVGTFDFGRYSLHLSPLS